MFLTHREICQRAHFSYHNSYVSKPFTRHSIWPLVLPVTKSQSARDRFTPLYIVIRKKMNGELDVG